MREARTWRVAPNVRAFLWFAFAFFLVVITGVAMQVVDDPEDPGTWFFIIWLVFVIGFIAVLSFRSVSSITVDGESVELRGLLFRKRIAADQIRSIESSWWDFNRFNPVIRTREGSVRLVAPFGDFFELLSTLRELNPSIEIKRL